MNRGDECLQNNSNANESGDDMNGKPHERQFANTRQIKDDVLIEKAMEATLLYLIPCDSFGDLFSQSPHLIAMVRVTQTQLQRQCRHMKLMFAVGHDS